MINVLTELETAKHAYKWSSPTELKVVCPFHSDNNPSCSINVKKQVFHCPVCDNSGDIFTFFAKLFRLSREIVVKDFSERYSLNKVIIDPQTVERYHAQIWACGLLPELEYRGINATLIRHYKIGYYQGRIMIPITDENGYYVNIRKYLPGAAEAKMLSMKGRGEIRIFPLKQTKAETIAVFGGELKAIVAAYYLNPKGIGCVTTTTGEGTWTPEFNQYVKGKLTYVCMDVDEAGNNAAHKLARIISRDAAEVRIVRLPIDIHKGDVNDLVRLCRAANENVTDKLMAAFEVAETYTEKTTVEKEKSLPLHEVEFHAAYSPDSTRKRLKFNAVVAGTSADAFLLPKDIYVTCDRNQKFCGDCPVYYAENEKLHTVPPESVELLELADSNRRDHRSPVMRSIGVPEKCKSFQHETRSEYAVTATYLTPSIEIEHKSIDNDPKPCYVVGDRLETSETYELVGRLHPSPKTQVGTCMISEAALIGESLQTYTNSKHEELKVFQAADNSIESLKLKLTEIYGDLECNVTRIFNRLEMHLAIDLTYFSCLNFEFESRLCKGWVETIIVGDSSQGKSQATRDLQAFYQLGEKVDGSNTSIAGVIGAVQKIGERWAILWGVLVRSDRRLVIFEELSDANPELISRLTEARSSGVATIAKAKAGKANCRTRLIITSNPLEAKIENYSYGCLCLKDLIPNLEDIRRFDLAIVTSRNYQNTTPPSQTIGTVADVKYAGNLHKNLILWVWSRTADQINISVELQAYIRSRAEQLCKLFSSELPLIEPGWTHEKIARLAIALAARVYSTDDGLELIVKKCHVDFVTDLIYATYSSEEFGYRDYSLAIFERENLRNESDLAAQIGNKDIANQLLYVNTLSVDDIANIFRQDFGAARVIISLFFHSNAIRKRETKYGSNVEYVKTGAFTQFLKNFKAESAPNHVGRIEL